MTEPTSSQSIQESAQALAQTAPVKQVGEKKKKKGCGIGCWIMLLIFILLLLKPLQEIHKALVSLGLHPDWPFVEIKEVTQVDWQEEVQLSDGSIVIVKREIFGKGNISKTRSFFVTEKEDLEILDANGEVLPPKFRTIWNTLLLDRTADGQWIVVVTQYGHTMEWNSCFAYKQYAVVDGQWQQVKFDTNLKGRKSNLTWNHLRDVHKFPKLMTLSEKPFGESDSRLAGGGRYYEIKFPVPGAFGCKEDDF